MNERIKKEIRDLQSSLPLHNQPDKKTVPQGYFDQLPDVVWERIQKESKEQTHNVLTNTRTIKLWKIITIAATLMLGISLITRLWNDAPATITPKPQNLVDLNKDELENYLLDISEYLEPEDLIPLLNDQISTNEDELNLPFEPSELEQYFETEHLELEEIL